MDPQDGTTKSGNLFRDDADEATESFGISGGVSGGAGAETGKPGRFRRLLDWLIRGAERSRRDRNRCPT